MKLLRLSLVCLLGGSILSSCVKRKFETPPNTADYDPGLVVNSKVQDFELPALGMQSLQPRVLGDSIFSAIIIGDDRSGNLYKKIIVEDTNGYGITIVIDKTYLYGDYPVGRRIYLKTKGLYLMNYKGTPEIVYNVNPDGTTNGIPAALVTDYIVTGSYPHYIKPVVLTGADLASNAYPYINTLVTLTGMQFDKGSYGVIYSNPTASTNRYIANCDHTVQFGMYNSNYATFQPAVTPSGNGSITGIVSAYGSTPQFVLRDTTDVVFSDPRCP